MRILCEFDNPQVIARARFWLKLWPKRNQPRRMTNPEAVRRRKQAEEQLRRIERATA